MVLSDRQLKILQAIINDYIATAEPIGSRTIAKKYDIGLSSATIRNEMSDLEDMGLIIQPHASAGRVPSDKGYRLYVDNLMNRKELTPEQAGFLFNLIQENFEDIESLMQETAKAISLITNYTTMVSEPRVLRMVIKHIQLMPYDESSIAVVLVTESKVIKNYVIKMKNPPDTDSLSNISLLLNKFVVGKDFADIDLGLLKLELAKMVGEGQPIISLIDTIWEMALEESTVDVYTSGVKNILTFPEFSDFNKAKSVFQALEEKDILITILGKGRTEELKIVIGEENSIDQIKDCSLIKAGYKIGNGLYGTIGILGPTRMNYSQVVSVLYEIEKNLNYTLRALRGG
ncbi:MAG: heat-inducible transcriptional repressor HrcA [Clostridiales bacterium]|jgi:heat-inducible transcriptional repressor|nr:heat-inducible transcriptional repressor HrcA [Clostridiales bacterium]